MTMYPPPGAPPGGMPPTGPYGPYGPQPGAAPQPVCTWHPDRATNLRCSRCGRPACPSCLTPASVGFHCRACVAEARPAARVAVARTIAGARHGAQPRVTYALIGINVLVFLAVAAQAGSLSDFGGSSLYRDFMLVPLLAAKGDWWRLVTSGFLHLSVPHIVLNMLALYFIGIGLERVLGAWRYLALYLLSLLGGSACVMLFAGPLDGAAGASGAIFGLMGALLVTLKRLKLDLRQAGIVIAINVIATFAIPGISWQAHVGGLVVGTLVGAAMVYAPAARRTRWQIGACIAALVVVVAVIVVKDLSLSTWVCYQTTSGGVVCGPPT